MYKCHDCGLVCSEPYEYKDYAPVGDTIACCSSSLICPNTECRGDVSEAMACVRCEENYIFVNSSYPFCAHCMSQLMNQYKQLIADNFREDEYDMLLDHLDDIEPYRKEN